MISIADVVAIRRAAALGHFVPGFGFRIRRAGEVLVEVGRDINPTNHPVYGSCEFRWSVAMAMSDNGRRSTTVLNHLDQANSDIPYEPLKIDWTVLPDVELRQSGLVEAVLPNGLTRWVFATLTELTTVSSIVDSLSAESELAGKFDGYYDDRLGITMVVVDQVDGIDREGCRSSANLVLAETMAQELLCDANSRAEWGWG